MKERKTGIFPGLGCELSLQKLFERKKSPWKWKHNPPPLFKSTTRAKKKTRKDWEREEEHFFTCDGKKWNHRKARQEELFFGLRERVRERGLMRRGVWTLGEILSRLGEDLVGKKVRRVQFAALHPR